MTAINIAGTYICLHYFHICFHLLRRRGVKHFFSLTLHCENFSFGSLFLYSYLGSDTRNFNVYFFTLLNSSLGLQNQKFCSVFRILNLEGIWGKYQHFISVKWEEFWNFFISRF